MGQPPGGKCGFFWKRVGGCSVVTENKSGWRHSQEKFSRKRCRRTYWVRWIALGSSELEEAEWSIVCKTSKAERKMLLLLKFGYFDKIDRRVGKSL
jgi:hypothetical protein